MTKYVSADGGTTVYELLSEYGEFYWILTPNDQPTTIPKSGWVEVKVKPTRGQVYTEDLTGLDVVVLGDTADGRAVIIPLGASPGDAVVSTDPSRLRPRRRPNPPKAKGT